MSTPTVALRSAALASIASGALTLGVGGVVPPLAVVVTVLLAGAAALASAQLTGVAEAATRRRVALLVLSLAALTALVVTRGDLSGSTGQVLGLLLCTAAVTHSLVLDTVRDLRVNTAIAGSMLVLAAGLAPGLQVAVPVVLTWTGIVVALALAARDAEGGARAVRARATAPGPSPLTPVLAAVAATVLVGLAIALVLPHPTGLTARSGFGQQGAGNQGDASASGGRQAQAYLGDGTLSLDGRGRLPDTPVAVVTGGADQLWRSATLDTYDGRGWTATADLTRDLSAPGSTEAVVPPDDRAPLQAGPATRTDGVGWLLVGEPEPVVLSPGLATRVRLRETGSVFLTPGRQLRTTGVTATPSYVVDAARVPSVQDAAALGADGGPDAADPTWLALPPTLPARVGDLAREVTAGTTDRGEAVRAVEEHLRRSYTYDLDSPVAPPGADSVDDFLFGSRSGFCEHFASAEVVMLRSLGIPARLVTGFSGGAPDPQGSTVLRSSDAHAWVEAWIPGTGWVSSDPTAGSTPAQARSTPVASVLRELATGSTARKSVLALLLVALAVLALYLPTRRRRGVGADGPTPDRSAAAPLFAAFHRLEAALAGAGRPRGQAESVRALAARLDATDEVAGALLALERASYAPVPPSRDEARAAAETIDRATARLLSEQSTR